MLSLATLALLSAATLADAPPTPELELRWVSGRKLYWLMHPPEGEHIAEGSEVNLVVLVGGEHNWDLTGPASALETSWPSWPLFATPTTIVGTMSASLCTDDGSQCRPVYLAIDLSLDKRRGKLRWTPTLAEPPAIQPTIAPTTSYDEAMALAAADGKPLLLDFSATWCPPCQVLAAEVLHNPDFADALSAVHLVVLDADTADSWTLKDRYAVGGYPSVVVVDPEGHELARMVGYPGQDAFLAWLSDSAGHPGTLEERLADLQAGTSSPAEAAQLALDLQRAGREDAARETLEHADDSEPAMRALLALDGNADALRWLVEHRMDDVRSWIWDGLDPMKADPELAAELIPTLEAAIRPSAPEQGSEFAALLAELASEDEAPSFYLQAAELLGAAQHDDPAHNRGLWSEQAWLYEQAGEPEAALAVLDEAVGHYPQEFTYHYSRARVLRGMAQLDQASTAGRTALEHAYGDQRLRAAARLAEILHEAGDSDGAVAVIDAELAAFERPAEGTDVRSFRYLTALEELRAALTGQVDAP